MNAKDEDFYPVLHFWLPAQLRSVSGVPSPIGVTVVANFENFQVIKPAIIATMSEGNEVESDTPHEVDQDLDWIPDPKKARYMRRGDAQSHFAKEPQQRSNVGFFTNLVSRGLGLLKFVPGIGTAASVVSSIGSLIGTALSDRKSVV